MCFLIAIVGVLGLDRIDQHIRNGCYFDEFHGCLGARPDFGAVVPWDTRGAKASDSFKIGVLTLWNAESNLKFWEACVELYYHVMWVSQ